MKKTDFRIGNLIYRKYYNPHPTTPSWELEKCEVVGVRQNSLVVKLKDGRHTNIDYWENIPIADDWLNKLGYIEIIENEFHLKDDNYNRYYIYKNTDVNDWFFCDGQSVLRYLRFVHELQNLFFALTNNELIYKP